MQAAVAAGLAQAAASSKSAADIEALRQLQRQVHLIAEASTSSLEAAAAELSNVHRRQVERARRCPKLTHAQPLGSPEPGVAPAPQTSTTPSTTRTSRTSMPSTICVSIKEEVTAPVPLPRPRSTPGAAGTPQPPPPMTDELNSPEAVRAYLAARKVQLEEQRRAAVDLRAQLAEIEQRQKDLRMLPGDSGEAHGNLQASCAFESTDGSEAASTPCWVTPEVEEAPVQADEVPVAVDATKVEAELGAGPLLSPHALRLRQDFETGLVMGLRRKLTELSQALEEEKRSKERLCAAHAACPTCRAVMAAE